MAKKTKLQQLGDFTRTYGNDYNPFPLNSSVNTPTNDILYKTNNKEEYDQKMLELRQEKFINWQWVRSGLDVAQNSLASLTQVKLMYRDCDLMDGFPEIGAALDIIMNEACNISPDGKMINIYSKSDRVKAILEDLFVNRLNIHIMLPMVARAMTKYGNQFMLLNIDPDRGVKGWKQLPVYEIDRIENGTNNLFNTPTPQTIMDNGSADDVKFVWNSRNSNAPFQSWQIAHFRLLTDSLFLPYGISHLNKARRHWRLLSMAEDMMLIYRLERSIDRRIFKVYVGDIDEADIQAYVQTIGNQFKRTTVFDPETGQVDLRKQFLDVSSDYFIPMRSADTVSQIETLPANTSLTAMDDIQYLQSKVLAALSVPKTFLNFNEAQGKGQNLSLMDIRFARTVNRIQQALLMELNKIATTHLYIKGFGDEIANFTLSMNNPTSQIEMQELELLDKRINIAKNAAADAGSGIPLMSMTRIWKSIMKFSDSEIMQMLNEMRIEKAMASELEKTTQIIKRTNMFDKADRIYGDPTADYVEEEGGEEGGNDFGGSSGGGGSSFGGFGGDIEELGSPMGDEGGELSGSEGSTDLGSSGFDDSSETPMEHKNINSSSSSLLTEYNKIVKKQYKEELKENKLSKVELSDKTFFFTNEMNNMINELSSFIEKEDNGDKTDDELL